MDPTTPQPGPGIDYLNSIATTQTSSKMSPKLLWLLIAGGLVLLIGIVVVILSGGPNQTDQIDTVAYELQALQSLTSDQQQYIQSSDLRRINSSLSLLLTNANHDIATPLANNNIKDAGSPAPDGSPVAVEFTTLSSKLDDARLNAVYDRTYARELAYQLDKMLIEMNELYADTNSSSLKEFLKTTYNNLSPIQKQFASFKGDDS